MACSIFWHKKVCVFTGTHTINFEQQRPHCSFILYLNNNTIFQICQCFVNIN